MAIQHSFSGYAGTSVWLESEGFSVYESTAVMEVLDDSQSLWRFTLTCSPIWWSLHVVYEPDTDEAEDYVQLYGPMGSIMSTLAKHIHAVRLPCGELV